MKILKNKPKIIAITFVLLLTISATLVALPTVGAHDPPLTVPTYCYVFVQNSVIGVNQQTAIVFWSDAIPPTAQGAYGDRWTFWIDVTKPDGSKETLGPYTSDPVGGSWTTYTPDQVGTYTIVARMDEHTVTGLPDLTPSVIRNPASVNDTYLADTSNPVILTAQEDPIEPWPEAPLPTQFWTRPISAANRDWYVLAANWLGGASGAHNIGPTDRFCYGTGPESAHIMWETPMWAGGIMDARFGPTGYQTHHYEGLRFNPIILNGKIYYNVQSLPREGWRVLDLYTGEELWFHNTTGPVTGNIASGSSSGSIVGESLAFGQILDFECPNQHGGFPYLWSTNHPTEPNTWMMFDAETGNYMCSIANVSAPRGSINVYGEDGSILYYNIANGRLTCWNTTQAIWWKPSWTSNQYWMWRPGLNVTYDGNNGFTLNVSIPDVQGTIRVVREGEFLIGGTDGNNDETGLVPGNLWCLSLKRGQEGTLLWNRTFTPPSSAGHKIVRIESVDPEDGVFLFMDAQEVQWHGYSLETGEQLWTSDPEPALNFYDMSSRYEKSSNIYQGKLLSAGVGGVLTVYNITTGKVLWKYAAQQVGYESPYGNYPIGVVFIGDGKIYLTSSEHSITQPLWRGSYLRCLDADTGEELWKLLFWGPSVGAGYGYTYGVVMADGFIVGLNFYDNQIYCIGKGPSETTVEAPMTAIQLGDTIMIRGTVTDQSPGAPGTPAIADEDQQAWMEYLYMQQGIPATAIGVEVSLDTVDPNGNFIHIDTVRSDMSGMFKKMWTPEMEGEYTIIATFEGSDSYYSSYAETAIGVGPAEAPSGPIEPEPTEPAEAPLITTEMAIIVAAVIVAVAVIVGFWIIRKRK